MLFLMIFTSANIYSFKYEYTHPLKTSFKTVVFCLHDIDGKGKYSITKKKLTQILDFLQDKFTVISLQEWYRRVDEKEYFDKFPVVLTFDDGYPSVRKIVQPLLKKYHMGATFYIYLNRYSDKSIFYKTLSKFDSSFEIASHSFTHDNLLKTYRKNPRQFFREIYLTKKKLEYLIQKPVVSFSWPYGVYDKQLAQLLRKAGYKTQVSVSYRSITKEDTSKVISRFTITRKKPFKTVKKILKKAVFSSH